MRIVTTQYIPSANFGFRKLCVEKVGSEKKQKSLQIYNP